MGQLAAFCPSGTHPGCGQGSVEELGGAGPGRKDEHALLLGFIVISQHAPERKQCLPSAQARSGREGSFVWSPLSWSGVTVVVWRTILECLF